MSRFIPDLAERLVEVVRRTIVECSLTNEPQPAIPPPSDIQAERRVLGALLRGEVHMVELGDLGHEHMFLPLHKLVLEWIDAAAEGGITPSIALIAEATANDKRISTDFMRAELTVLAKPDNWTPTELIQAAAERIVQLADARQLLEQLARSALELRTETITPDQFRARLLELGGAG